MTSYHQCGSEMPENAQFCPNCGLAVRAGDSNPQASDAEASTRTDPGNSETVAQIPRDVRNIAVLCHLSAFAGAVFPVFGNILGPLVVWLLRRKDSHFIDFHGRQSINFQISLTIYLIVSAVLIVVKSGLLLLPVVFVFGVTMVIIAAVRANEGIEYRYPLAIPFLSETPIATRLRTLWQTLVGSLSHSKRAFLIRGLALAALIAILGLIIMALVQWVVGFFIVVAGLGTASVIVFLGIIYPLLRRIVSFEVATTLLSPLTRRDSRNLLIVVLGVGVAGLMSIPSNRDPIAIVALLILTYLLLQFATRPLSRLVARIGWSIRWKLEIAVVVIAILFLSVGLITFGAMEFMHDELHNIQELDPGRPLEVIQAVNALEDTNHGPLFTLMPFLGAMAMVLSATLGSAMAWSVISPVRKMEQAMLGIGAGDFSQSVKVENRDELGELANRINETGGELIRLHEATLADERARALQERIAQVTLTQEEERRRISRELHDGLGPSLAAIGNRLRSCRQLVRANPDGVERELDEVTDSLKGQVQDIRKLIYDLRPLALDQLGLIDAVRQQVERFSEETGVKTNFSKSGEIALNPLVEVTLFRITQECLNNIRKHAGASEVDVRLEAMAIGVELTIEDDGRGFNPHEEISSANRKGMGLLSMRERAELIGGNLSVQSLPGSGCRVVLHIPC